jgi:hypothetical protein
VRAEGEQLCSGSRQRNSTAGFAALAFLHKPLDTAVQLVPPEPGPKAPEQRCAWKRSSWRPARVGGPWKDLFHQGATQDCRPLTLKPVIGVQYARREKLEALSRLARHVIIDPNGEGSDHRRGAGWSISMLLACQAGHERHDAHRAFVTIANATHQLDAVKDALQL